MVKERDPSRVVIMGAAGRDFHNFNMVYRDNPDRRVLAFTAAQIPDIAGRRYPAALSGGLYPDGIEIVAEDHLAEFCRINAVDEVVFAYSDVSYASVMQKSSIALAADADFVFLGPRKTSLRSDLPVISVCAVRTGCGKSQISRWLSHLLKERGLRCAIIRHPMPYGDLAKQAVQRFAVPEDLDRAECTIEEREEYEPHLAIGNCVYAGVDYAAILKRAEQDSDLIIWDGGNNDFPFIRPDLSIVLADALRPAHITGYHPGEAVLRTANIAVIAKADAAPQEDVQHLSSAIGELNPGAEIIMAASQVQLDNPEIVRNRRVLVIEDGPTLTHGGMAWGAGHVAATQAGAAELVDPRMSASGDIAEVFETFPHIGAVLPAMGYSPEQLNALERTINASSADFVISATPCDLAKQINIAKPLLRARYEFAGMGEQELSDAVNRFLSSKGFA